MSFFRPTLVLSLLIPLTLIGCAQPNGKPLITFMKNAQPLSGKWYGQVSCANGEADQLTLDLNGMTTGKISGAIAVQGRKNSGLYNVNGQFEQDGTLRLSPAQWLQKTGTPSSWSLTGKADDINAPSTIRGNIPECNGSFELARTPVGKSSTDKTAAAATKTTAMAAESAELIRAIVGKRVQVFTAAAIPADMQAIAILPQFGFTEIKRKGSKGFPTGQILDIGERKDEYANFTRLHYEVGKLNNDYWVLIFSNEWTYSPKWKNMQPSKYGEITDLVKIGPIDIERNQFWPIASVGNTYWNDNLNGSKMLLNGQSCGMDCGMFAVLPKPIIKRPKKKNSDINASYLWDAKMLNGHSWKLSPKGKLTPMVANSFQIIDENMDDMD